MVIKVGINGFGRIGRVIFRICIQNTDLELSAINDPAIDVEYICYLMKFDSTHGTLKRNVIYSDNKITVDDNHIKVFHEKQPSCIPWHTAGVQYVVEASGMFTSLEKASGHLVHDGVKRVILTAPSADVPMIILGVNQNKLHKEHKVLSCASSTLYCLAPIIKVLEDHCGVAEGFITSIHAMTPSLKPLDGLCLKGKHWRDYRSIHQNIIPANTGACKALGRIIPQVKDKISGLAFRVPIVNVSVLDLTIRLNGNTTIHDIVKSVEKASITNMQNIIKISNEEAVSSDFIGDSYSCILDVNSSLQLKPDFFKLICWYENEYSYACRVVDSIFYSETQLAQLPVKSQITYIKAPKKQGCVEQTESNKKEMTIDCTNAKIISKVICSNPQDTGFNSKLPSRPVLIKKPCLFSHNSGTTTSTPNHFATKKRNDILNILTNESEISKPVSNTNLLFQRCLPIAPQIPLHSVCMKAQERIEHVKREFSELVNITEDLLTKSYNSKMELNPFYKPIKDEFSRVNPEEYKSNASVEPIINFCDQYIKIGRGRSLVDFSDTEYVASDESKGDITRNISYKNDISDDKNAYYEIREKSPFTEDISQIASTSMMITSEEMNLDATQYNNNAHYIKQDSQTAFDTFSPVQFLFNDKINFPIEPKTFDSKDTSKDSGFNSPGSRYRDLKKEKIEIVTNEEFKPKYVCNIPDYYKKDKNVHVIDDELKNPNIILINDERFILNTDRTNGCQENTESQNQIFDVFERLSTESVVVSECVSLLASPITTTKTSFSNSNTRNKQDIFDKLDSVSATDSNNSFEINEKKSQVIHITDVTNSLDDLGRLDKICRIIEISDELSEKLFSSLDKTDGLSVKKKRWSFKDLCERIKLDDFCNNVFGKT